MTKTIEITPQKVVFFGGKFDSDFFYIRSGASGEFQMPVNFTLVVRKRPAGGFYQAAQFYYSSGTYTHIHAGRFDSNQIVFDPATVAVKFT